LSDSLRLHCLQQFFLVRVNDSLYCSPDWLFHEKPGTLAKGLIAYLPTTGFKTGKNVLTVRIPDGQKPDSLRVYGVVPFWFETGTR
jgi:hypothetical protein